MIMAEHPNNIVNNMRLVGHTYADMLPAYPGHDATYLDELLRDNARALTRPVIPYGLLGINPCQSRYFNVEEGGFRSNGISQPWPPAKDKTNIFFFGGSTTVGFNTEDHETVPANLHRMFTAADLPYEIYNFGSGNYTSRHEFLRFLDLLDQGIRPDYAIFLDGYNDSYYAFGNTELVAVLDWLYQREKKYRRSSVAKSIVDFVVSQYRTRRIPLPSSAAYSSGEENHELNELLSTSGITAALNSRGGSDSATGGSAIEKELSDVVWNRYLDSVSMTKALAANHDVKTLFVWQPVPLFKTQPRHRVLEKLYFVFPYATLCSYVYKGLHAAGYPTMSESAEFLNLADLGESVEGVLYVDVCHYSAMFSEKIAKAIFSDLARVCGF